MTYDANNLTTFRLKCTGLDVVRTDRTLVFYEKQENLSKLWDILAVYAWIDTDVGYCQGHRLISHFLSFLTIKKCNCNKGLSNRLGIILTEIDVIPTQVA